MGLRTDFAGYWIEVMVERAAKVIFFCHISNDRSSFTNPHPVHFSCYNSIMGFRIKDFLFLDFLFSPQQSCIAGTPDRFTIDANSFDHPCINI